MKKFISPKQNRFLLGLLDRLFPVVFKAQQNIREIIFEEGALEKLRAIKDERMLYFSNHPTTAEPPIAFRVAHLIGTRFFYMASRQVFEWGGGMVGKVIRNIGAFSVVAGTSDRDSLKMSRSVLSRPGGKLVIFPEGEPTSGENESLMPFQPGIAQLSFWAMQDALKKDPAADIYVVPSFIKYVITDPAEVVEKDIHKLLTRFEKKLGIDPLTKNFVQRMLTIGRILLEDAEREYGIEAEEDQSFDYRAGRVRHKLLDSVAAELKIPRYPADENAIVKLRYLFSAWEIIELGLQGDRYPSLSKKQIKWLKNECLKAFDMIVINQSYILERPTPERLYEWMARLEQWYFHAKHRALGGEPSRMARKAYVYFAEPFKLSEYYNQYRQNKAEAFTSLMDRIRNDMQAQLDDSMKLNKPLEFAEKII